MMAFVARIVIGVAIDPTSHNLWPFEILMAGAMSAGVTARCRSCAADRRGTGCVTQMLGALF